MGMVHWFKGVISSVLPGSVGQGVEAFEKKGRPKLIDVTDGYFLVQEARKLGVNLVRKGRFDLEDFRTRFQARRKIRHHLSEVYDLPEIVEEITETLVEGSHHDSRLKRLFS